MSLAPQLETAQTGRTMTDRNPPVAQSLVCYPMKVWYNSVHDSRRSMLDVDGDALTIGRDRSNELVLESPLVSKKQAIVRKNNGKLRFHNLGINSCLIGETEVLGGSACDFDSGQTVRIWPYSLTFETEQAGSITRDALEAHLRTVMSDLELRVHRKLLDRFDLYELENQPHRRFAGEHPPAGAKYRGRLPGNEAFSARRERILSSKR